MLLLMDEIPNNHLECMKPYKQWDILPYQLVQDFFHQQYCWISEPGGKKWCFINMVSKKMFVDERIGGVSYMVHMVSNKMVVDERIGGVSFMVSKMFVDVVCCCFYSFFLFYVVDCLSIRSGSCAQVGFLPPTKICKI